MGAGAGRNSIIALPFLLMGLTLNIINIYV